MGDLFDRRKYINFATLQKARDIFLDPLAEMVRNEGRKVYIIPGNHDIHYRNTLDINSLKLTLGEYPFELIFKPQSVKVGKNSVLMVPWICDENRQETLKAIESSTDQYCFAHLELVGFEYEKGIVALHGDSSDLFEKFDKVLTGHYHNRSNKGNIHYVGAAYEFTWSDYRGDRGAVIFDMDTGEIEYLNNPYRIHHVYEYNDNAFLKQIEEDIKENRFSQYADCFVKIRVHEKTNPYIFDKLIEAIQLNNPAKLNIIEMNSLDLETVEIDLDQVEDTPTLISKYIDDLGKINNSGKVKELMKDLYKEAISLENMLD